MLPLYAKTAQEQRDNAQNRSPCANLKLFRINGFHSYPSFNFIGSPYDIFLGIFSLHYICRIIFENVTCFLNFYHIKKRIARSCRPLCAFFRLFLSPRPRSLGNIFCVVGSEVFSSLVFIIAYHVRFVNINTQK